MYQQDILLSSRTTMYQQIQQYPRPPPKEKKDKIMGRISTNNAVSRICTNSKQKGDHQKKQLALWINM